MKTKPSRRDFLKVSAAGTLGAFVLSNYACKKTGEKAVVAAPAVDLKTFNLGLQLYTIRDAMSIDPALALARVSKMGYKYIELASYADGMFYGLAPAEFRKVANDLGLEILSSHTQVEARG